MEDNLFCNVLVGKLVVNLLTETLVANLSNQHFKFSRKHHLNLTFLKCKNH
jgi:hypothetical protein